MHSKLLSALLPVVLVLAMAVLSKNTIAGEPPASSGYTVLSPIHHANLMVFPVVAAKAHQADFLTLDEGLRSGEVVVTEYGRVPGLIRQRNPEGGWGGVIHPAHGAEVNRLVLVNNSKRPLLLLAGEIVTGGKQDRVIGKDRIVPAESDPIDLSVFCVEPGRWVATTDHFGASEALYGKNAGVTGGMAPMALM